MALDGAMADGAIAVALDGAMADGAMADGVIPITAMDMAIIHTTDITTGIPTIAADADTITLA